MKRVANPLRTDPTRTALLRRRFAAHLRGRFARIRAAVVRLVGADDAFGLRLTANALWEFQPDAQKIQSFERWLALQLDAELYGRSRQQLLERYLEQSFRRGVIRSAGTPEATRLALSSRLAGERLELLAARSMSGLRGVGDAVTASLTHTLADGLTRGESAGALASRMGLAIDRAATTRATSLANTEVVRSYTEGQLTAYTTLGLINLQILAEWQAFANACPLCADMDGLVVPISQAWGLLPAHPNCRCIWRTVVAHPGAIP